MVCLFAEDVATKQLERLLGNLGLTDPTKRTQPTTMSCLEIARRVLDEGGFWFAAHVTNANGILRLGGKDGGGLHHIWRDDAVRVMQIPGDVSDLPENYRAIVQNENPDYARERPIVPINAKDVAKPEDLADPRASSWVKMTRPSFEAFRIAFLDPESRIRLRLTEAAHGAIESIRIRGGYLDGLEARVSEHLNALIGGRGTGKSTLIEAIRYVLELPPKGKQATRLHQDIVKENLGKQGASIELTICSAAQHSQQFTVSRRFGEPPIVRDAAGKVSHEAPRDLLPQIEIYGQNEIFELAQDGPSRLRLVERFLPANRAVAERHEALRKKLGDNAQQITKSRTDLDELTEQVARLPKLSDRLKGFQSLGVEGKLEKVPLYARERTLAERAVNELERLDKGADALRDAMPDLAFLSDKALEGLPDAVQLSAIRALLEQLSREVEAHRQAIETLVQSAATEFFQRIDGWKSAHDAGEQSLESALASLPDMAGKTGREIGTAYRELTQEIERIKPLDTRRQTLAQLVAALEQERSNLVAELSDLRAARSATLATAVDSLNERLKGKLRVRLRVESDHGRLKDFVSGCRLEGVGDKRLAWIEEREVKPLTLARAIREGASKLAAEFGVTPMVAESLAKLPRSKVLELEGLELSDDVGIELNVAHEGQPEQYRDLSRLSTGQQCTAVLHLLLLDNPDPLVIDQPEDNLDNAFIAERIVRELRDAKTRRQFLFSTHNANIPVFGDAEWIGVLTAGEGKGTLEPNHQGSIDVPLIREQAAEILEGGRAAFARRKEMYEF